MIRIAVIGIRLLEAVRWNACRCSSASETGAAHNRSVKMGRRSLRYRLRLTITAVSAAGVIPGTRDA